MPDDPLIGFDADGLRFESLLGRGAMGAVYKGTQVGLNRIVAIKVIAPHLAEDPNYLERFLREGHTLGRLRHPHVIACHDIVRTKGPHGNALVLIALEFVDGWSLGKLLKKKHRLTARQVIELHRQAAEGLSAAHQLGIIHRDVKPDNIMVTRNGQAKLADFGLAMGDESAMLTQTGAIMGSPSYMAPEACRGEPPAPSADCYSLGCSLFHSLTGVTPYRATSAVHALHQHIHAPIPLISSRRPDLAAIDGLMTKLLAKNAEDRYCDASEVASVLKSAITNIAPDAPAGISTTQPSTRMATVAESHHPTQTLVPSIPKRQRLWRWIGAVFTVLLALALLIIFKPPTLVDEKIKLPTVTTKDETATRIVPSSIPPGEQKTVDHFSEAMKHLDADRLDEAEAELNKLAPSQQTDARRVTTLERIRAKREERIDTFRLRLQAIEMQVSQKQREQARLSLRELKVPNGLPSELREKRLKLIDQTK